VGGGPHTASHRRAPRVAALVPADRITTAAGTRHPLRSPNRSPTKRAPRLRHAARRNGSQVKQHPPHIAQRAQTTRPYPRKARHWCCRRPRAQARNLVSPPDTGPFRTSPTLGAIRPPGPNPPSPARAAHVTVPPSTHDRIHAENIASRRPPQHRPAIPPEPSADRRATQNVHDTHTSTNRRINFAAKLTLHLAQWRTPPMVERRDAAWLRRRSFPRARELVETIYEAAMRSTRGVRRGGVYRACRRGAGASAAERGRVWWARRDSTVFG